MSKCGKGCMPECKYFTTGGCISPFNCPYKIETGYINSATSTTDSLTGLLMEFDEMGLVRQYCAFDPEKYAIEEREKVRKEIERLKSENADLRERLEKAVELPCKVGDTIYQTDTDGIRIFEGDIIECDVFGAMATVKHKKYLVVFENGTYVGQWSIGKHKFSTYMHETWGRNVVGNKWDNSELLEVMR